MSVGLSPPPQPPITPREIRRLAVGLALVALQLGWMLATLPLLEPDEGRYLDIPRHMLAAHDWVTPRLNGVLYFEKPPLHYWLTAFAIKVIGLNALAVRIWNTVFAILGVLGTWCLARRWAGPRAGLAAAAILGSAPLWIGLGRLGALDMAVSFFITATLGCVWLAARSAGGWPERLLWWGAFAAAAGGVLTKGLIGAVIPAAVAGLWVLLTGQLRLLRRVPWVTGVSLLLLLAAPWHLLASLRNPDFAWFYFVHEHVLRYATPVAARQEPWWFFLAVVGMGTLPWSGHIPSSLRVLHGVRRWHQIPAHRDGFFFALWFGFIFLFFSASQSKLIPYMGPALPALAVLLGAAIARQLDAPDGRRHRVAWIVGPLLLACVGGGLATAGLGRIDRLGLGGTITPWLLGAGVVLALLATLAAGLGWRGQLRPAMVLAGMAAVVLNLSIPRLALRLAEERSSKGVAAALRPLLAEGDPVLAYRDFQESLAVYLDRPVGIVGAVGELAFGVSHLPPATRLDRFPSVEEFRPRWDSDRRVWLSVGGRWERKMAADGLDHVHVVWRSRGRALVTNHPLPPPGRDGRSTGPLEPGQESRR